MLSPVIYVKIDPGLKKPFVFKKFFIIKGVFTMTKIKDQLSREKAVKNVYMMLESIFEASSKIEESVTNYPDTWVVSLNKNLASFLVYVTGIETKYIKEIKPTIKK